MSAKAAISHALETKVREALRDRSLRDRALILTGLNTGFRCQELAALTVGHVTDEYGIRTHVRLERARLKGGAGPRRHSVSSRQVPLNAEARAALQEYLFSRFGAGPVKPRQPLFPSRKFGRPLGRWQIATIIKDVMAQAGDTRRWLYATHSLRRTFCRNVYETSGRDINLTRAVMGHRSVATTQLYLPIEEERMEAAVLNLAIGSAATVMPNEISVVRPDAHERPDLGRCNRCV